MADKIKEALFSSLASLGVSPYRVLDLFAGSGAVGIEALSRGGVWCDFVDRDYRACKAIRLNLEATGFSDRATIYQTDIRRYVQTSDAEPYDFVIVDPPYADPDIIELVIEISQSAVVEAGTVFALGHWPKLEIPDQIENLVTLRNRCHGDSCFSIFEVH